MGSARAVRGLLLLFVLLATTYSVVVPPYESPDEIWHMAYIQQLAEGGGLPVSAPGTDALWRQQGSQAPAYYLAAAALTGWIDQSDFPARYARANPHAAVGRPDRPNKSFMAHLPDERFPWRGSILALHLTRFLSVVLGAITLWAGYRAVRLIADHRTALLGSALLAFIPQFIFISGSANNDNLINAVAALALWQLVAMVRGRGASNARLILLGLLVGLGMISKASGLWLLPLAALALALTAARSRDGMLLLRGILLIDGVAVLVGGWWYLRNRLLYGDLLGVELWRSNILLRDEVAGWRTILGEYESLDHSFWGLFGWFNLPYPVWIYRLFQGLELLILLGLIIALWRGRVRWAAAWRDGRVAAAGLLGVWILFLFVSWVGFMRIAPAAQGRYFFPAAPTLALVFGLGLAAWRRPPAPRVGGWGIVGAMLGLAVLTPFLLIAPAYAPTRPLDALPPGVETVGVTYGEALRLEGVTLEPREAMPGDDLTLTLYWRALEPIEEPLSISVKAVGRGPEPLVVDDSYPDAGRWPTPAMPVGRIVADRKRLVVDPRAEGPVAVPLRVDVYRFETLEQLPTRLDGVGTNPSFPIGTLVVRDESAPRGAPGLEGFRATEPRVELSDGEVLAAFTWEVGAPLEGDYRAFFHLTAALDQPPVAQNDFVPQRGLLPTTYWRAGDRLAEQVSLALPSDAALGEYLLTTGLYDPATTLKVPGDAGRDSWVLARLVWNGEQWRLLRGEESP